MSDLTTFFGGGFDPRTAPPDTLPPGEYPVMVDKAEVKATKAGNGHYIKLELTVLDGPAKGRKLFDQINIQNANQQCVDIGLRQLASLGKALGIATVQNTDQLVGQAVLAKVAVKDEQDVIRSYKPIGGSPPAPQAAPQSQSQYPPAPQYAPPAPQGAAYPPQPQYPAQQMPPPVVPPQQNGAGKPPWAR